MDALSVLREWASSGCAGDVAVAAGRVRVGSSFDFDAGAPTRWTSRKGAGDRLTVGAAAFFAASAAFKDASARFGDYLKAARDAGVPAVAIVDRKVSWCELCVGREGGEGEGAGEGQALQALTCRM